MHKKLGWMIITAALAIFAGEAIADCEFNGNSYPEGSVYGDYVCEGGTWKKRD